jgi:hypothetical protein
MTYGCGSMFAPKPPTRVSQGLGRKCGNRLATGNKNRARRVQRHYRFDVTVKTFGTGAIAVSGPSNHESFGKDSLSGQI